MVLTHLIVNLFTLQNLNNYKWTRLFVFCICILVYHIKSLSLKLEDQAECLQHADTWDYMLCLQKMFPFNCIEDDAVFISEIHATDLRTATIKYLDIKNNACMSYRE